MKKESLNDELKNRSPLLNDLKRQGDGFRVPEGYLEALEDSVLNRIKADGTRRQAVLGTTKGGLFVRFMRPQILAAAAATIALLLAATWFFRPQPAPASENPVLAADLTEEEIEAYVLENIREFDAEQLAALPAAEIVPLTPEPSPAQETKPQQTDPLDDLSEEELDLLLKEMSDEELENLLKT